MIARRFAARSVLASCALGLTAVSVVGGSLMAAAEGVAHSKGSLALFNVITTVVLGDGPTSSSGKAVAAVALVAATCWLGIASVTWRLDSHGLRSTPWREKQLRPLAPRRGSNLVQEN
jgi:hypothetical protein